MKTQITYTYQSLLSLEKARLLEYIPTLLSLPWAIMNSQKIIQKTLENPNTLYQSLLSYEEAGPSLNRPILIARCPTLSQPWATMNLAYKNTLENSNNLHQSLLSLEYRQALPLPWAMIN